MKIVNHSTVEYIDHMGDDNTVVDAARVSFDKNYTNYSDEQNHKLIKYLAKHKHWSPFAHTAVKFRVIAPIFVARQLVKHQVGGVWNEVSRRYVSSEPVFYFPEYWRKVAENAKQGSSEEIDEFWSSNPNYSREPIGQILNLYEALIEDGVCPEQARMVLPQNTMTSWIWTGSLVFWDRVCKLRMDSHAQAETREVAIEIAKHMKDLFPVSWEALQGE